MPNFWTNSAIEKQYNLVFNNAAKSGNFETFQEIKMKDFKSLLISTHFIVVFKVNVKFPSKPDEAYTFQIDGKEFTVSLDDLKQSNKLFQCDVNGHRTKLSYFLDSETKFFNCFLNDKIYEYKIEEPQYMKELSGAGASAGANEGDAAVSPMPGIVDRISVKEGDLVKMGDPLCVMIAMKMEYVLKASRDGRVKSVNCSVGQSVKKSTRLIVLE